MKKILLTALIVVAGVAQSLPDSFLDVGLKSISKESKDNKSKLLLKVVNPVKFVNWIDSKTPLGSFAQVLKQPESLDEINGTKIKVEIDNEKFTSAKDDSVVVSLDSDDEFIKLFKLHLTIDDKGFPTKGIVENIDKKLESNGTKTTLKSNDTKFTCQTQTDKRVCNYEIGSILGSSEGDDEPVEFDIKSLKCMVASKDMLDVEQECLLPTFNFYFKESNSTTTISSKDMLFKLSIKPNGKKFIDSYDEFNIKTVKIFIDDTSLSDLNLTNLKFGWSALNIDKNVVELSNNMVVNNQNLTDKQRVKLLKELVLPFIQNGAKYSLNYSIEKLNGKTKAKDTNSKTSFNLSNLSSKYNISFDKSIHYKEYTKLANLNFSDDDLKTGGSIENVEYGIELKGFDNLFPKIVPIFSDVVKREMDDNNSALTKNDSNKINDLINGAINKGFELNISPVAVEKIMLKDGNKVEVYGSDRVDIRAKLDKNSADMTSQMGVMSLLGSLNVEAKASFAKKDYEFIKKLLPMQFAGMASLFSKEKDGKIIFDIEFKKGKLSINGKGLM